MGCSAACPITVGGCTVGYRVAVAGGRIPYGAAVDRRSLACPITVGGCSVGHRVVVGGRSAICRGESGKGLEVGGVLKDLSLVKIESLGLETVQRRIGKYAKIERRQHKYKVEAGKNRVWMKHRLELGLALKRE